MATPMGVPALSIVVSTIGRPVALRQFLDSLIAQPHPNLFEVIVVDQSEDQQSAKLVEQATLPFHAVATTSGRGACRGRNVGTALARGEILAFPDDNCRYTPSTVDRVLSVMSENRDVGIVSGLLITESGTPSMLRWPSDSTAITRRNVQQTAIEATMFVRRRLFAAIGGFDESIGVGSAGPYQAGEATDLILRALATGAQGMFDPTVHVVHEDFREAMEVDFAGKMKGYGTGIGHVYRANRLPAYEVAYYASRKIAAATVRAVRGRRDLARADIAWAKGLVGGYVTSGHADRQLRSARELEYRGD